jgi:DNA-binding MarR family transcriptional regulator
MTEPDEVIHQSMRLRIVAALNALPAGEAMEFAALKSTLGATDGNLGAHLATLEKTGYINVTKEFVGRKPKTSVSLTRAGRRAFDRHVNFLKELLEPGD